ncbi:heterokaryon incompatibility protein-domain-containing protein [Ustulina deusta]|nr:heterokaryon incompatibility protein-domain-containing protein [Ustulina deusta]
MWLINCRDLTLVEVGSRVGVKYAIFSHTWEDGEEVQFDEFKDRTARTKRGWEKIRKICRLAGDEGYEFAWCDTCCINKTSSAELTEAINSMFPWYAAADICYVYLVDYDHSSPASELSASRWFTRGWTLQELIAPAQVRFYDASWATIGTKATLSKTLSSITGIEEHVLRASKDRKWDDVLGQVPVAARMAWAARRKTTRIEDMAYCLLGIFGVNLPMLYGEGERAFIRLQEEIVRTNNDLSLFAWRSADGVRPSPLDSYCGVFARHPRDFGCSGGVVLASNVMYNSDFTMSNKGVKIEMDLSYFKQGDLHVLFLNCHNAANQVANLGIFLKHQGANVFARARPHEFASRSIHVPDSTERKSFFLNKLLSPSIAQSLHAIHRCAFVVSKIPGRYSHCWTTGLAGPGQLWDGGQRMFIATGLQDFVGYYEYRFNNPRAYALTSGTNFGFLVFFGYGYGFKPWLRAVGHGEAQSYYVLDAVERGDMRMLAQHAAGMPVETRVGGLGIIVELLAGVRNGEPVFLIDCKES